MKGGKKMVKKKILHYKLLSPTRRNLTKLNLSSCPHSADTTTPLPHTHTHTHTHLRTTPATASLPPPFPPLSSEYVKAASIAPKKPEMWCKGARCHDSQRSPLSHFFTLPASYLPSSSFSLLPLTRLPHSQPSPVCFYSFFPFISLLFTLSLQSSSLCSPVSSAS